MFCYKVLFRMYLSVALVEYNRLFIDRFGFLVVNRIKKHLLGLTQSKSSPWPSVLISRFGEN